EMIAANAWPARVGRDGTLHVATSSSVWAFELAQLAPQILERLGDESPTALRFALGHLPATAPPPSAEAPRERVRTERADEQAAEQLVVGIDDEDLRKMVAKAAALSLARRRYDRGF